jgi:succinate dehydrogenase / fumarate reductase flavoprotein subunit
MFNRTEMLDLVVVDGAARGIVVRDLVTGKISSHAAHAVVLATGGYGNVFFLSTNAKGCNATAAYRAYKRGAFFANPCFVQVHPTCIPRQGEHQSKLTLMSESLRNDGRVWVPARRATSASRADPRVRALLLPRRALPGLRQPRPPRRRQRNAKIVCDEGHGVNESGYAVYLDFADAIGRDGEDSIREQVRQPLSYVPEDHGEDPYKTPMKIYPAVHYTMGGLWVDYNLMSNLPGLHVVGEANFSDHGANRLGASALMQGLADGYFVLPYTIGHYLWDARPPELTTAHPEFKRVEAEVEARTKGLLEVSQKHPGANKSPDYFHKLLGKLMWDECGLARNEGGLQRALEEIPKLRERFWREVRVPGVGAEFNQTLEKAGRIADFLEFAEIMCHDALDRAESCGCHLREESQTPDGEALRKDEDFSYVAAWEYQGVGSRPTLHKEELVFENIKLSQRSYK